MGFIWNVLLCFDNAEFSEADGDPLMSPDRSCEPLKRINDWIPDGKLVDLTKPTWKQAAGYGMDVNLFGGGFKRFDIDGFVEVTRAQKWKEPDLVQLWIRGGEEGLGGEPFVAIDLRPRHVGRAAVKRRSRRKPIRTRRKVRR